MNFYDKFYARLRAGERIALLTVTYTSGSVPRKAGTKMLVSAAGDMLGTIGGGCPEVEASKEAISIAARGGCKVCRIEMRHTKGDLEIAPKDEEVLICGGMQEVILEALSADTDNGKMMLETLERISAGEYPKAMLCRWTEDSEVEPLQGRIGTMQEANVQRFAYWPDGTLSGAETEGLSEEERAALLELAQRATERQLPEKMEGAYHLYAEPFVRPLRMIIAGAGHVAVPLCKTAAMCGYAVTVVDDREEFATRERFPDATQLVSSRFSEFFASADIDDYTSIVIITRGHRCDEECLHSINGRRSQYLGMIGSHHRVAIVRERLREMGYAQEWIDSLHAPIGLSIGAQTPEEIAVAIMAQVIGHRYRVIE